MNLQEIIEGLKGCPCGKQHTFDLKVFEADRGLVHKTGEILNKAAFPKKLLIISDKNAMGVSKGLLESLKSSGFTYETKIYDDMRYAYYDDAMEIAGLMADFDGLLSVGTGSINDICRYGAFRADKPLAIFATAPSMDGFASDSSPLIKNNFKISYLARQPMVVIADTDILAASPAELKSAGYGDILAKYIAIVDWKVAKYTINEYYCDKIVDLVKKAIDKVVSLTDKVTANDPQAAGAIMEGLILTGCAMQLAGCTRPASGCEHVISHYWEIHKLEKGIWPEFHGKKVGVATLLVAKIYKDLLKYKEINPVPDSFDMDDVLNHYSKSFKDDVLKMNNPQITDEVDLAALKAHWADIRRSIQDDIPDIDTLTDMMKRAGCATTIQEVNVSDEMCRLGIKYSPYMRHRITLLRIINMLGIKD